MNNSKYTIGINFLHSDSSACIFVDNKLIAAVEEERFTRSKHTSKFPINSIKFCLEEANISISDVSFVTINTNPYSSLLKKSLFTKARNNFIAGVVVLIPIGITLYLTVFFIKVSGDLIPKEINPNNYLPFNIPGVEIIIALIIITLIGWLSLSFLGKKFFEIFNNILKKIPILRTIYSAIGQMTETFTKSDDKQKSVVLLEYPRKGVWAVGFATKENEGLIKNKVGEDIVNVFVPTTPNPTSGFLLMVPKKDLIYLDISFEQASKFIVSAGTTNID